MADLKIAAVLAALLWLGALGGCASNSGRPDGGPGSTHVVQRGENLYRIGKRYGVSAEVIQQVNGIGDVTTLQVGQRLWIPAAGSRPAARSEPAGSRATSSLSFRWPVRGRLTSAFGTRGGSHEGIDIAAPRGTAIVSAEAGKVIFAGRMGDYGKMVVVKHAGDYRSVYAHLRTFSVRQGHFVESGQRIGEVGATGNASGPHLHFEIRKRDRPRDPLRYLP